MVGRIFEGFGLKKQGSQGLVLPKFNHDKYLTDPCPQVHKSSFFKKYEINQGVYADPSCEYIGGREKMTIGPFWGFFAAIYLLNSFICVKIN